jgi:hypothetical protein
MTYFLTLKQTLKAEKTMTLLVRTSFLIAVFVSVICISSCATLTDDIQVETHADPDINYSKYKTYAWAGSAQIVFDPVGQWEQPTLDTDEEVRLVVNRELRARGFNQVENNPDLFVAFVAGVDTTVLELKKDPGSDKTLPTTAPKAALVIALIDANSGYLVWLGYAIGDAQQQQTIDNIRARIDYAVSQILNSYNE